MTERNEAVTGLTSTQAKVLQERYGKNELIPRKKEDCVRKVVQIICEPMFLLLIVAAVIYFILGEPKDGAVMLIFVLAMISIDVIQEWKTDRTLNALKELSAPKIKVIRDGEEQTIASVDLVPGDLMMIYEGVKIPADGMIMKCNDLCVDESSLTGEAEGVWKVVTGLGKTQKEGEYWRKDYCYAGTLVTQGNATIQVECIGTNTEYGRIGIHVASAPLELTPLQKQTGSLVKLCAGIAVILFALVGIFTYWNLPDHCLKDRIIESILSGVTLAMAMIPEEFPVILTVFLSMGAWRLAKKSSLVRKLPSVETLGAVTVLCVDKTGTITMNQMKVQETWAKGVEEDKLIEIMGLGCETDAYDPMEKAMLSYCEENGITKETLFQGELISEYAFTHQEKMMGHVWSREGSLVIAAKGSPECFMNICELTKEERIVAEEKALQMSKEGLRVIAVAVGYPGGSEELPSKLSECRLTFLGFIGLADPPRQNIKEEITKCKRAGIRVVMITGDNGITASSIATKVGMDHSDEMITGDMLNCMEDEELRERARSVNIFSRVIPEHKMRIVKALKENGEIVAMTGDGVNDAPALKFADIGIAMGKRGSEVSKEAADLILLDDNFSTIVETVRDGRRIYDNIRKAVGYVVAIHIPIAASSLLAPFLGINPVCSLLLPLHVVLLELIIDPTCSIVLERQPAEADIMNCKPRDTKAHLLNASIIIKSMIQGIVVFAASFGTYYTVLSNSTECSETARAMGLVILILSNLFLVVVNSSEKEYAIQSIRRLAKDKLMWGVLCISVAMLIMILYTPLRIFLKLATLSVRKILASAFIAFVAVFWYEVVKGFKHKQR